MKDKILIILVALLCVGTGSILAWIVRDHQVPYRVELSLSGGGIKPVTVKEIEGGDITIDTPTGPVKIHVDAIH